MAFSGFGPISNNYPELSHSSDPNPKAECNSVNATGCQPFVFSSVVIYPPVLCTDYMVEDFDGSVTVQCNKLNCVSWLLGTLLLCLYLLT